MKSVLLFFQRVIFLTVPLFAFCQTASTTEGCSPLRVDFTAPPATTICYWDFDGAGFAKDSVAPSPTFYTAGTYHVLLYSSEASFLAGDPPIGTPIDITVYPAISVTLPNSSGCIPFNATLSAVVVNVPQITVTEYSWAFGDGNGGTSATPTIPYQYNTAGTFEVAIGIETNIPGCDKTFILSNVITTYPQPVANFSTVPANLNSCNSSQNNIPFTNNSTGVLPMSYSWTLGNGNTFNTQNIPNQSFSGSGSYTNMLTASYTGIAGCTNTISNTFRLGRPIPTVSQSKTTICAGDTLRLITTTPGTYSWYLGADASPQTSTNDTVDVTFTDAGNHTIVLSVTSLDGLCTGTKLVQVFVDKVTAEFTSTPTFSCDDPAVVTYQATTNQSNVRYDWAFGGDTSVILNGNATVVKTYNSWTDEVYYDRNRFEPLDAVLLVTSLSTGCKAIFTKMDTLWLPNARFVLRRNAGQTAYHGCAPLRVGFVDSSDSHDTLVQWHWVYDDGGITQTNPTDVSTTHIYTTPGVYYPYLVVTTKSGCIDTSYAIKVEVGENISAMLDFTIDNPTVCIGQTVNLTSAINPAIVDSIDGYHFYGEGNRISHCAHDPAVGWTFTDVVGPQNVFLQVDYNGCLSQSATKQVTVNGALAKMDYLSDCEIPMTYNFESESLGATNLTWDFGDGGSSTNPTEAYVYTASGNYTVTLTASDGSGCAATTDTRLVRPRNLQARFTREDSLLCIKQLYQFDGSSSVDEYLDSYQGYTWEFNDFNNMRTYNRREATPEFAFQESGLHYVKLVVRDINGCTDSIKHWIRVFDIQPNTTISDLDRLICLPDTIQFNNTTTSDTTQTNWSWAFGDGGLSALEDPSHIYTSYTGRYTIDLVVTDELGCKDTAYFYIDQYIPTSSLVVTDTEICVGDTTRAYATDFTGGGSFLHFNWTFTGTNPTTSILQDNTQLIFNAPGSYPMSMRFVEDGTYCEGTLNATVNVQAYPVADFTTNRDAEPVMCSPAIVAFTDASSPSGLNIQWDFGNTKTASGATVFGTYDRGEYDATQTVTTSYGCSDQATQHFSVQNPGGNFTYAPSPICKGDSILFTFNNRVDVQSFTFSFGDGEFVDDTSPVWHTYNFHPPTPDGSLPVGLTIRGTACQNGQTANINIERVISEFSRNVLLDTDSSICFSELPYNFFNNSIDVTAGTDSVRWEFGNGIISSTYNPVPQNYPTGGTYPVKLYVQNRTLGCKDSIIKDIVIFNNPVVNAVADTACERDTLFLRVTDPNDVNRYAWTPATGLDNPDSISTFYPNSSITTLYTVVATDTATLCTASDQVVGNVINEIDIPDSDTTIIVGDFATLQAYKSGLYYFDWQTPDGLSCLDCNFPVVQPMESITYHLILRDIKGCFSTESFHEVTVRPETFIKFPTLFTPNGDGSNDVIRVRGWGIRELLEFKIFNRWGELVYESTDLEEGWDGKFKGEYQNTDVYAYKVKVRTWRETEIVDEGYFNLIR